MRTSLRYTYDFVRTSLPGHCPAILEIGCGSGELARLLREDGFEVTAVDSDPAAVAEARANGVDARAMSWPESIGRTFDAVLFTRSLHHIHELDEAVAAAVAALRPDGRIIVEDFRAEGAAGRGDAWFAEVVRSLEANRALRAEVDTAAILDRARPAGHEHELHSSAAIADALAARGRVERSGGAYYFRYVEPDLGSPATADAVLTEELAAIRSGDIDALGQRFILTPAV